MRLYNAALAGTFAPHSSKPVRAAYIRIGSLATAASGISFLLAQAVRELPLAALPETCRLILTAVFAVQLVVLLALLTTVGIVKRTDSDTFARLLLVLPLSRRDRWLALGLPSMVLAGLAVILASWPLGTLFISIGLHPLLLGPAALLGATSALGIFHGLPARLAVSHYLLMPLFMYTEYKLLVTANNPLSDHGGLAAIAFLVLCAALALHFPYSSRFVRSNVSHIRSMRPVRGLSLPPQTWFAKALFRTPATRLSFTVGLGLSIAVAAGTRRFGLPTDTVAVFAAVVMAAFVSDIRSLARRDTPVEIAGLRATRRFAYTLLCTAIACCTVIAAPFVWATGAPSYPTILLFGAAIAAGIFAGALLTPQPRDISGQFLATLLCVSLLIVLPHLPLLPNTATATHITNAGLALLLLAASFWIEYNRNTYQWRKHHV